MDCRLADTDTPDLGIGIARQQALAGCQRVVRYLKGSGVHVYGDDPPAVTFFPSKAIFLPPLMSLPRIPTRRWPFSNLPSSRKNLETPPQRS